MRETEDLLVGQVELNPDVHLAVSFQIDEIQVSAVLPPHRDCDDIGFVVGVEDFQDEAGEHGRRYLKIPRKLRAASHAAVEYYESHDNLQKGVKVAGVAVGIIAVGSLTVMKLTKRRS